MIRRVLLFAAITSAAIVSAAPVVVHREPIHLRAGDRREWDTFPVAGGKLSVTLPFHSVRNAGEYTLLLRQRDVRNGSWSVSVNGRRLGPLVVEQRELLLNLPIGAGLLRDGENTVEVTGVAHGRQSDDVEIRDVVVESQPIAALLRDATLAINVTTSDGPVPCRLTIVDERGALIPFAPISPSGYQAVRPGVMYYLGGRTTIGLPAGRYRVYASRGFEYNAPSRSVTLSPGKTANVSLTLHREVALRGYVSADTHVHTFEISRHGDASIAERVLTVAGEGLDLAVTTEHNRARDYTSEQKRRDLSKWFVSLPGNEVTTAVGHFNVFPADPGKAPPDPREQDWAKLTAALRAPPVRVVILNHPEDEHSGYRPFDPRWHLASVGENLNGRPVGANAMEVVNSAALTSDLMRPVHDWLGLLTRGMAIAAIGSSDTHTVAFATIGQARTYIDVAGTRDWRSNPEAVVASLEAGRNAVSFGLMAELKQAAPPERSPGGTSVSVDVRVWGPSWATAERVVVFGNRVPLWQGTVRDGKAAGLKLATRIRVPVANQDVHLVAVATGPAVLEPFWQVLQSSQPVSETWAPSILGLSAAIPVDVDGDGAFQAPLSHAQRLVAQHGERLPELANAASAYDEATVLHVLNLLRQRGVDPDTPAVREVFHVGAAVLRRAHERFVRELRQTRA